MYTMRPLFITILLACTFNLHAEDSDSEQYLKKLETFGGYIQASIENENPSYLNNSIDIDHFVDKILNNAQNEPPEEFKQGFVDEMRKGLDFGTALTTEISNGGSYEFLNAKYSNGKGELLFRLLSPITLNYHIIDVSFIDNEARITDIYVFQSGERLSESLGRIYHTFSSLMNDAENTSSATWNAYLKLGKINNLVADGKYKKAYKTLLKMPEDLRTEKSFQIIEIQIASQLDKEIFHAVYEQYIADFPEIPGKYLIPLDGLIIHDEHSQTLDCIEKLDKCIDTDPLLDFMRANIFYAINDYENAIARLVNLIGNKPEFENGYFSLLNIYIERKKYNEATYLLDKMIDTFNYYKEDFEPLLSKFPEFINSQEYKNWIGFAQAY